MSKQQRASDKQVQAIYRAGQQANGWTDTEVDAQTSALYGVGPAALTKAQASQWLMLIRFANA